MPRCSDSDAQSLEAPQSWNAIAEALKRVAALHGQLEQQARVVGVGRRRKRAALELLDQAQASYEVACRGLAGAIECTAAALGAQGEAQGEETGRAQEAGQIDALRAAFEAAEAALAQVESPIHDEPACRPSRGRSCLSWQKANKTKNKKT
mmetsp:Transcript_43837/g.99092  ORF Transcript_43837/g.99092 Transcript_43837/m.99092 type:complete len:151 (+) Transcript_43837:89-541(+)